MKTKIKLEIFKSECKECGKRFEIANFPDFEYGRRIVRTEDGKDIGLVVCYEDKVFDEVGQIVNRYCEKNRLTTRENTRCFNEVFGLSCDTLNGKAWSATQRPVCQYCGSSNIDWNNYSPPKSEDVQVMVITHDSWNSKNNRDKEALIFNRLDELKYKETRVTNLSKFKKLANENKYAVVGVLFFISFFVAGFLSGIIWKKIVLYNEYGYKQVHEKSISMEVTKPYIIFSTGKKIVGSGYKLLHFIMTLTTMFMFFLIINFMTRGWYRQTLSAMIEESKKEKEGPFKNSLDRFLKTGRFKEPKYDDRVDEKDEEKAKLEAELRAYINRR